MKGFFRSKAEKVCFAALICMLLIASGFTAAWLHSRNTRTPAAAPVPASSGETASSEGGLTSLLPTGTMLNEPIPAVTFQKEDGSVLNPSAEKGKILVLTYWASWCPHCQKLLEQSADFSQMLQGQGDVDFWLVDKLDGQKETKQQAEAYLKGHSIPLQNAFDTDLKGYQQLGIQIVPTTLVIDKQGILRAWHAGDGLTPDVLKSMISYAREGAAAGVRDFITQKLTGADGGIHTGYKGGTGSTPSGNDVLSESQGLVMEYAVQAKDKNLFEQTEHYVEQKMRKNPLASWVVTVNGPADSNAALDDLRIYGALSDADALWGGYAAEMENEEKLLYHYDTEDQTLINGYDFKSGKKTEQLSLCYADFRVLEQLAQKNSRWKTVEQNCLNVVEQGKISDQFPLYYGSYDLKSKQYSKTSVNMAEEMTTLLHLAQISKLPKESYQWIQKNLEGDGIFARYNPDGTVADGYRYESTAVYALAAQIAMEEGDSGLANRAIGKMESMRIFDAGNPVNGAFGNADGTGIYSFDQCTALLAYAAMEQDGAK